MAATLTKIIDGKPARRDSEAASRSLESPRVTKSSGTFSSRLSLLRRLLLAWFLLLLSASGRIDSLRLFQKEMVGLE